MVPGLFQSGMRRIGQENSVELRLKSGLVSLGEMGADLGNLVVLLRKGGKKAQRLELCKLWLMAGEVCVN